MKPDNHTTFFSRLAPLVVILMLVTSFAPLISNDVGAVGGGGDYPYSGSGDWLIDSDTFVYNETVVVNGNLIIQNGGKLTLRDTTIKMNVASDGEYYIEVQSGGELNILDWDDDPETRADRCVITDGDDDDDDAAYNTADNHRFTMRVRNGATFVMKNSELREAGFGSGDNSGLAIDGRSDFTLENNYITRCYRGLCLFYSYGKAVRNNTFDACEGQGIIMYYVHDTIIEDNVFQNCAGQGFYLYSNNNADYNLYAARTNIIRNNKFKDNNYGAYFYYRNCYDNLYKNNEHDGDKFGITLTTDAHNNTFIDNTVKKSTSYGIYIVTRCRDNTFINTTLEQNNYGVVTHVRSRDNSIINSTIRYSSNQDIYMYDGNNLTLTGTEHENKFFRRAGAYLTDMRYVNINVQDARGNPIPGADVRVISREDGVPEEADNLAHPRHGTLAYANSEYNWKWVGERVIDGLGEDGSTQEYYWLTKDSPPADTYLTLDLTQPKTFDTIRLLNVRNAGYYDRSTGDFRLGVSNDGTSFDIVYAGTLTEDDITTWYELELDPTEARYIRFYVDSYYGSGAGLAELEVYNTGDTTKAFDFTMYATDAYGGTDRKTDANGDVKGIPALYERYYGADPAQLFTTDVEVSYHGWEDENLSLIVTDETDVAFIKDTLTVGPAGRDFTTIQAAVDYANQETKVMVFPATYTENVVVNDKELDVFTATDDHTDTILDTSSGTGFTVSGSKATTIDGFVLKDAQVGVSSQGSGKTYANLSFDNAQAPFQVKAGAALTTIDSVFTSGDIIFDDATGVLYEKNNLVVRVHDRVDDPVNEARVKVVNVNSVLVADEMTGADGNTDYLTLAYRTLTRDDETVYSPYTLTIRKGEGESVKTVDMSTTRAPFPVLWFDPSRFGESLSIGDFDGDGVEDYVVGAPGFDGNGNNSGAVFIYQGSDQLILDDLTLDNYDWVIYGERPGDMFGAGVAMNGDLTGDGKDDLVVGAPNTNLSEPYGITARYYHSDGEDRFAEFVLERREYGIDYNWQDQQSPHPDVENDFAAKWYGFISIEAAGDYTFYTRVDDGVRFYLNEELLIESWISQGATEYSADPVFLEAGLHPFLIEYYEGGGPGSIRFSWSSDFFEKQVIAAESFRYTTERGPGNGGAYLIDGRDDLDELADEDGRVVVTGIVNMFLAKDFGVEDFGKDINFLGDLNDDGYDELGILASRVGYDDQDRLHLYQGTPLTTFHQFKSRIMKLPDENEYRKDFTTVFDPLQWDTPITGNRGVLNISDEGYLEMNTSASADAYAYVVTSQGIGSGMDFSVMFRRGGGMEVLPVLSIMNYSVPESDVNNYNKQEAATLLKLFTRGDVDVRPSPGANAIRMEGNGQELGYFPIMRVVISPEHDNLTVYLNGMVVLSMDISGWDEELYILVGEPLSERDQGATTITWLMPGVYEETLNTNGPALSFDGGEVTDNGRGEFVVSANDTQLYRTAGKSVFPTLDNDTLLFDGGAFNDTAYVNGTLSIAYGVADIVPNSDFDSGWDSWTQTQNVRDKNNGEWELTTEEHGDWHVFEGGPTAGLGPDRDNVASGGGGNGRDCEGRLVSEPFEIPAGTGFIDLWHHAKWWSFEYPNESQYQDEISDHISIRLVNDGNGGVVAEQLYEKKTTGEDASGEEEGRIQFDVSAQGGNTLRLEVELVNNYQQYDDGLVQIDNIRALTAKNQGFFVSENLSVGEDIMALIPQWNELANDGTVTFKVRTDDTDWPLVPEVKNGEVVHLPAAVDRFQYRFELEKSAGKPSPLIRDFEIHCFNDTNQPLQFNTTGDYRSLLGKITDDEADELLLSSGSEEKVLVFEGSALDDALGNGEAYFDMDDYLMQVAPDGGDVSEAFGERASIVTDVDRDGLNDVLVSDPMVDGDEEDGGVAYIFYSTDVKTELDLGDAAFDYKGDVKQGGLGTEMTRNLVSLSNAADPRVELLPFYLVDVSVSEFSLENDSLVYPDTSITLTMTAANIGYGDLGAVDYYMNISSEDGSYTTGFQGVIPGILADSWVFVNQSWDIPAEEEVLYYINLTLVEAGDQNMENNERVILTTSRYYKTNLTPEDPMDSKRPNEYLIYNITIDNIGTLGEDLVELSAEVPAGWEYAFLYRGTEITNLSIDEGDDEDIQLLARSPLDEPLLPQGYDVTVNASSQNGITFRYLGLKAYLVEVDILAVRINLYRQDGTEIGTSRRLIEVEPSTVEVELLNMGNLSSGEFDVDLYQDEILITTFTVTSLDAHTRAFLPFEVSLDVGEVDFRAVVDEENKVFEYTEVNNEVVRSTTVMTSDPESGYTVYGTIFNLDGDAIEEAELRVSIEGYSHDFSAETDANGQANVTLTVDDYFEGSKITVEGIKGSKYAYVIDYAYSLDGEIHVELALMKYSLNVQVDRLNKIMYLNNSKTGYLPVDYVITVNNTGVDTESYELSAVRPFGWTYEFIGDVVETGANKYALTLESKNSTEVLLRVTNKDTMDSPRDKRHHGNQGVNITLTVESVDAPFAVERTTTTLINEEDNLTIDVLNTDGKLYEKDDRFYKNLTAGTVSTYIVNLINYGNSNKRFHLVNEGKYASYVTLDTTSLTIDCLSTQNYRAEFNVELSVPEWLKEGEEFHVDILLMDENNTYSDTVRLSVLGLKRKDVELEVREARSLGANGTQIVVELSNPTADELFVELEEISFIDFRYTGTFLISPERLTLEAGAVETITISVFQDNMELTTEGELLGLKLTMTLDNDTATQKSLSYKVPRYHHLTLTTVTPEHTFYPGEIYSYALTMRNLGNGPRDIVSFTVDDPGGWAMNIPSLAMGKGEELELAFRVEVPQDAGNGDYNNITITPSSSNGEAHKPLRLTNQVNLRARDLTLSYYEHVVEQDFVNYTLRLRNDGSFNESIRVEAVVPDGYVYTLVPENFEIAKGRSKFISLVVEAPTEELGSSNYTIRFFSREGTVSLIEMELPGFPVSKIEFENDGDEYTFSAASEYTDTADFMWVINQGQFPLDAEKESSPGFTLDFQKAGDYTVTLITSVTDETMGRLSDRTTVFVTIENQKPDLSELPEKLSLEINETFTIDASSALDLDGSIADIMFSYNGSTTHATKFTSRFDMPGDHIITITVVDNLGAVSEKQVTVTVAYPEPPPAEEEEEHFFSGIVAASFLGIGIVLLLLALLIAPKRGDYEEEQTSILGQLEQLRSFRKVREEEIQAREKELAEIRRIQELEKTHQKCGSCGEYVPTKMNFCNKCGKKMKTETKACPKCGSEAPLNVLFCLKCGNEFPKTLIDEKTSSKFVRKACSNCGNVLQRDDAFCDKCGKKVKSGKEEAGAGLRKCPTCGRNIGRNVKFCIYCGEKFGETITRPHGSDTDTVEVVEE